MSNMVSYSFKILLYAISMFRFFTELVMKTLGHFLRPPMRRLTSSFTTSTSLSSEESCQTREIKVSCLLKKWYLVRSLGKFPSNLILIYSMIPGMFCFLSNCFFCLEIKESYLPKKRYQVRSLGKFPSNLIFIY
jgi:hypothetical protein